MHLAGAGIGDERWTDERKRELIESRTRGTALLAVDPGRASTPGRRCW